MTTEEIYPLYLQHPVISTDTRNIAPGSLFFALKGEKFDANTFAEKAIEAGAAYAIIDNPEFAKGDKFLLVEDVLSALQDLARHHRRQLTIPVIGLTGTNGKTTTKELINAVLSQRFNTLATQGNLNNHIGVPLTILSVNASHQMAVIEMGANHQKEIALLCSIAQPSHGLITNVGKAHLEGFGGVEGVKKGKGELYDFLHDEAGRVAFINSDDKVLMEMQRNRNLPNVVYYGKNTNPDNLVSGKAIDSGPLLSLKWNNRDSSSYNVKTQLTGSYNLDNILAAACIGSFFGLESDEINAGIEGYQPKNNRSQIMRTAHNTLICDFYNANPSSMFVAIDNMDKLKAANKIMILGDMFEMGDESAAEHHAVIKKAMDASVDQRIFIGKDFYSQQDAVQDDEKTCATFYLTAEDAIAAIQQSSFINATILIKGSRGMALERLAQLL
ncbi:UDP-N-acetylmuramoyl-tripeptide--D-alanyl-D-alanine ligase [Mucilaginibacter sp. MD40]|nr:UDP-N-acetylmuramoyl-tripeptide--D-alanyl-D-alanine ligase [Mucilaginibacter sp. MD40]PAW95595.1 UDP-N-acetylmuramoyl-tripeptide--D-alanyl-D-alanine ligase [Mucilaginibacter sp. MD40]